MTPALLPSPEASPSAGPRHRLFGTLADGGTYTGSE